MHHYLEFTDDKSNKFWEITLDGKSFTVRYGKIGTDGQTQTKDFSSTESAEKEAEKLLNEKLKKGYVEEGKKKTAKNPESAKEKSSATPDIEKLRKNVTNIYGFDFPDDFYRFPLFCADLVSEGIVKPDSSGDLISSTSSFLDKIFGMSLGAVFTPLEKGFRPSSYDPISNDRYYNDPPEFFSILSGTSDGEHWGYWVDDPASGSFRVCSYCHNDSYEFHDDGGNLFEAFLGILGNAREDIDMTPKNRKLCDRIEIVLKKYISSAKIAERTVTVPFYDMGISVPDGKYRAPENPLYAEIVGDYIKSKLPEIPQIEELAAECRTLCEAGFPGAAYALGKRLWLESGPARKISEELLGLAYNALGRSAITSALGKASVLRVASDKQNQIDLPDGAFYLTLPIKRRIMSFDVHPEKPLIIAGIEARIDEKENYLLGLFDYEQRKLLKSFPPCGDRESAARVLFDATGTRSVFVHRTGFFSSSDFDVRLIDIESGGMKKICPYPEENVQHDIFPTAIALLRGSNTLLVGSDCLRGYDLYNGGSQLFEIPWSEKPEGSICLAASPDGSHYAVGGVKKGKVTINRSDDHKVVEEYAGEWETPLQITLDGAGKFVAILDESSYLCIGNNGGLYVFDRASGERVAAKTCDEFFRSYTPSIAAASDGSCIVIGHQNGYLLKLTPIDAEGYSHRSRIDRLHQSSVNAAMFLSNGLLATAAGIRIAVRRFSWGSSTN